MKQPILPALSILCLCATTQFLHAQTPEVPDWALPHSATHQQVPPPVDFRRASTHFDTPIGIFEGQTDVGTAVVPGDASYNSKTGEYTIDSAGYNIWYTRDEFRYLWKKMTGDVSLAANISYPIPNGFGDRKVVLIFRQDLDDDSKEIMVALHGERLIHLAQRPTKGAEINEDFRIQSEDVHSEIENIRLGIEKKGDIFSLHVGYEGKPMQQVGNTGTLHFDGPFYVGIAFCSHLPATSDTGIVSKLVLENAAGKVH